MGISYTPGSEPRCKKCGKLLMDNRKSSFDIVSVFPFVCWFDDDDEDDMCNKCKSENEKQSL